MKERNVRSEREGRGGVKGREGGEWRRGKGRSEGEGRRGVKEREGEE